MKQLAAILIAIGFYSCNGQFNTANPQNIVNEVAIQTPLMTQAVKKELDSVDIDFQFRGNCYAYSSIKNAIASNGEAHSDNLPKKVDKSFPRNKVYLVINQNELSKIDSASLGCKLYLINTTYSSITLEASDSRLYIVAEALNYKNEWIPISYLPSSGCGNSYHKVILDKDEYWSFDVPIFKGLIKTKLRYTLTIDKNTEISSNEVIAYVNKGQFDKTRKEGYRSDNIMDLYTE
jgi:hypothetical protein